MISYRPLPYRRMGQAPTPAETPAQAPMPAGPVASTAPAAMAYTGVPGVLETLTVVAITASAAWIGVRTGLTRQTNPYVKTAAWVGGIGSGLLGLLYLGQRAGMSTGLPKVQVSA